MAKQVQLEFVLSLQMPRSVDSYGWLIYVAVATAFLLWVVVYVLLRRPQDMPPSRAILQRDDAKWIALLSIAIALAGGSGAYALRALSGFWSPGDYRGATWFVAGCLLMLFVMSPLIVGTAIAMAWRLHHRKPHD